VIREDFSEEVSMEGVSDGQELIGQKQASTSCGEQQTEKIPGIVSMNVLNVLSQSSGTRR
jgi:hypothetical protein